jgi:hypothetical protein
MANFPEPALTAMTHPHPQWQRPTSRSASRLKVEKPTAPWLRTLRLVVPGACLLVALLTLVDFLLPRSHETLTIEWSGIYQDDNNFQIQKNGVPFNARLILEGRKFRFNTIRIMDYANTSHATVMETPMLSRPVGVYPGPFMEGKEVDRLSNSIYWLFPMFPIMFLLPLLNFLPLKTRDSRTMVGMVSYTLLVLYSMYAFISSYYWE